MDNILLLILALIFIVISSELFCNAIEHLGAKIGVSEGVTGSIFAAVATALPETMIPILAIVSHQLNNDNHEIAAGAILGAPLMLSTLSMFLMGFVVLKKRGLNGTIKAEPTGLNRDLKFFLFNFSLVLISAFTSNFKMHLIFNYTIAVILGVSYFMYLLMTVNGSSKLVAEGHSTTANSKLFISHVFIKNNMITVILQLVITLLMLIYFAGLFIDAVNNVAITYRISPFLLSLIVIPIATELPEKINSILWIRKGRDTLALGNITGAMVFQGSILPIFGILFTPWKLTSSIYLCGILITILATSWLYYNARKNNVRIWHFGVNGIFYLVNLLISLYLFFNI